MFFVAKKSPYLRPQSLYLKIQISYLSPRKYRKYVNDYLETTPSFEKKKKAWYQI